MFQASDLHYIPTNELSQVVISVVPVLSCVITVWVCVICGGVVAFISQNGWVAVWRGGEALGSSGGGRIGPWAPWGGPRVGRSEQRSALRVCFAPRSFSPPTSSSFLLRLGLGVLWVVASDALFAHRTRLLGLCKPRVHTLAVVGWQAERVAVSNNDFSAGGLGNFKFGGKGIMYNLEYNIVLLKMH